VPKKINVPGAYYYTVTSTSAKHHTPSPKIVSSALLLLTLQGDTFGTFPLMIGRSMKGFYLRKFNFKFSENNQRVFRQEKGQGGCLKPAGKTAVCEECPFSISHDK